MRRLRDFQVVSLTAGNGHVRCRVVAVGGGQAVLEPQDRRSPAELQMPCAACLGFDTERHPIMLSGLVDAGPVEGTLRFFVTDHVGVREWRLRPRLTATLDVEATPVDGGTALRVQARDLSAGGAFLQGLGAAAGARLRLTIAVPGLEPVRCTARVVRRTPQGAAVAFEDLDPATAATIDELIFTVRREICRRAFEDAERRSTGAARPVVRRDAA